MNSVLEKLLALTLSYSGLIRSIRNKGKKYAKILLFHSVSNRCDKFSKGPSDTWISDSLFVKHLDYLRKYYHIISLQELVESLNEGKIQERSVVITFDDGFADNYHFAYPILKKYQIPATIFLATEAVDNRKPLWIQKFNYLINEFGVDKIIDKTRSLLDYTQFERTVNNTDSRDSLHKQLEQFLAYEVAKQLREEFLRTLYAEFSISMEDLFLENKIFLNWEEIKKMHANGIRFGNHGGSHTPFSALSNDDQIDEVFSSKDLIKQYVKHDFLPFAYPFGQKRDFSKTSTRIIDDAGHRCILTAMPTLNHANTSRRELGRIVIENIPVYQLAYELEKGVIKSWLK